MILTNDRGAWNPSSNKCAAVRALDLCPKPNIAAVNQPRQRIRSFHKANDNRQKLKYPRDLVRDLCGISGDPRQSGIQPCIEQAPIIVRYLFFWKSTAMKAIWPRSRQHRKCSAIWPRSSQATSKMFAIWPRSSPTTKAEVRRISGPYGYLSVSWSRP